MEYHKSVDRAPRGHPSRTAVVPELRPAAKATPARPAKYARAAVSVSSVSAPISGTNVYDAIVIGMGHAGSVVLNRLVKELPPGRNKVLCIEAGGPLQGSTGGVINLDAPPGQVACEYPATAEGSPAALTYMDVPGEYNNIAFHDKGEDYRMAELPNVYQGTGYGGNGCFNGMLYQEPAKWWFDRLDDAIPDAYNTLHQHYKTTREQIRVAGAEVTSTPSTDGVHYNHGLYDLVGPILKKQGFDELTDMSDLNTAPTERVFGIPSVVTKKGVRSGAEAWLNDIIDIDGNPSTENLEILRYAKATKLAYTLGADGAPATVTGVHYDQRPSQDQSLPAASGVAALATGGRVMLCCGSLGTARLLYLSGVGPQALFNSIFQEALDGPDGPVKDAIPNLVPDDPASGKGFAIDNPAIGVGVTEHVATSLAFRYKGVVKEQPGTVSWDTTNYVGNIKWVKEYQDKKVGPYTQFGPVLVAHFKPAGADGSIPAPVDKVTTEIFFNPLGVGPPPPPGISPTRNPYNGPGAFSAYCMLLRPKSRALVGLDANLGVHYTDLYMHGTNLSGSGITPPLPNYEAMGNEDVEVMAGSVNELLQWMRESGGDEVELIMGPGVKTDTALQKLDPTNPADVQTFVESWQPLGVDPTNLGGTKIFFTRLMENHFCSTVPLSRNKDMFGAELDDAAKKTYGLDPDTLAVKGLSNLHVVDASIVPEVIYCHPVATVIALGEWGSRKIIRQFETASAVDK